MYKKKQQEKKQQEEKEAAEKAATGITVTAPSSSSSSSSSLSANLMGPDAASAGHSYPMSNNPTPSNHMAGNIPASFNDDFSRQWQQVPPPFAHL